MSRQYTGILPLLFRTSFLIACLEMSCNTPVKPDFSPKFLNSTIQTKGQAVAGSVFRLYAHAEGAGTILYRWIHNTTEVAGADSDTLVFSPLADSNAGAYVCIASNGEGADTTDPFDLAVSIPPKILAQPQNQDKMAGDSASFTVSAAGSAPLTYQWQRSGADIPGAREARYMLYPSAVTDSGAQFACIVSNAAGADTSDSAILIVRTVEINLPPRWVRDTMVASVKEAMPLVINLKDSCSDPNGDTIYFSLLNGDPATDTIIHKSTYSYTPDFSAAGAYEVFIKAADSTGSSVALLRVTVRDSNRAPVCKDTAIAAAEGASVKVNVFASDPDANPLSWTMLIEPKRGTTDSSSGAVKSTAHELTYKSDNLLANSLDTMKIEVSDGSARCTMAVFVSITADNDKPAAGPVDTVKLIEDQTGGVKFDITGTDPEKQPLTWEATKDPAKGTLAALNQSISSALEARYDPLPNANGVDSFSFRVSDGVNNSAVVQVYIRIAPVNDKPHVQIYNYTSTILFGKSGAVSSRVSDVENRLDSLYLVVDNSIKVKSPLLAADTTKQLAWTMADAEFNAAVIGQHNVFTVVTDKDGGRDTSDLVIIAVSGSWRSDSLSIRALLDSNRVDPMLHISNFVRTDTNSGRIDTIFFTSMPSNFSITRLIPEIGNVTDLLKLNMLNQKLTSVHTALARCTKLSCIALKNNQLAEYPTVLQSFPLITRLTLDGNRLATIPATIGHLTMLKTLSVIENQLQSLPPDIGKLGNLEALSAGHNKIAALPAEIGQLKKITFLDLSYNLLTDLPAEIAGLTAIPPGSALDLSHNRLPVNANPPKAWEQWADLRSPDWRSTQDP